MTLEEAEARCAELEADRDLMRENWGIAAEQAEDMRDENAALKAAARELLASNVGSWTYGQMRKSLEGLL